MKMAVTPSWRRIYDKSIVFKGNQDQRDFYQTKNVLHTVRLCYFNFLFKCDSHFAWETCLRLRYK